MKLGTLVYESGPLYPLDLLATAAMNRLLNLTMTFCALIETRDFLAAVPLAPFRLGLGPEPIDWLRPFVFAFPLAPAPPLYA